MVEADFKMLEFFYNQETVKLSGFHANYTANVDTYGQTSDNIKDTLSALIRLKYLDRKGISGETHCFISEAGKTKYTDEKQRREAVNKLKSLGEEKLSQDVIIGRKTKYIWWFPYVATLITILISGGSLWLSLQTKHNQEQLVTQQDLQEKLELSRQSVLRMVDSLYQKGHNAEFVVKKKVPAQPPFPLGK